MRSYLSKVKRLLKRFSSVDSQDTVVLAEATDDVSLASSKSVEEDSQLELQPVDTFNARDHAKTNLEVLSRALARFGVEFSIQPWRNPYDRVVVVPDKFRTETEKALAWLSEQSPNWNISERSVEPDSSYEGFPRPLESFSGVIGYTVFRIAMSKTGRRFDTSPTFIHLQFWMTLPEGTVRSDGGIFEQGTLHSHYRHRKGIYNYFEPEQWERARNWGLEPGTECGPMMLQITEPIDLVYTWVDGSDPQWLKKKSAALGNYDLDEIHQASVSPARFLHRDELKYSLRSVEMYADWVNHIYIVTDGQVPAWLDTNNDRITVVDHKEIFSNLDDLPVFNSHAIESQLHHIPGLNKHYLYLNDDIFFGKPVEPESFFTSSGLNRFFLGTATLDLSPSSARDNAVTSSAKHGREIVNSEFSRVVTHKFQHAPHAQNREFMYQLEEEFPEVFRKLSASKFRHPDDVAIVTLSHYLAYFEGKAMMSSIQTGYLNTARPDLEKHLDIILNGKSYHTLCLNDTDVLPENKEEVSQMIGAFLEEIYPFRSSFEKP